MNLYVLLFNIVNPPNPHIYRLEFTTDADRQYFLDNLTIADGWQVDIVKVNPDGSLVP